MALVHDMAESIVGDLTPQDRISKEEKYTLENNAFQEILTTLGPNSQVRDKIHSLWKEYEEGSTKEAQIVKDIDKFEMIFQAYEYEVDQNRPKQLQEFFDGTKGWIFSRIDIFLTSEFKELAQRLVEIRERNDPI
ncbi:HD domain-containing protein 2 [Thelohanellus kitauei]|uniref:HD domain-containing protein 2 n=1 Tax=Thelohanellus kitauei TaxID=669202 RepID=A0A0C2J950_THEKT|nr:HD domain-containing protein 2 [Thelohanellus kitauei]